MYSDGVKHLRVKKQEASCNSTYVGLEFNPFYRGSQLYGRGKKAMLNDQAKHELLTSERRCNSAPSGLNCVHEKET